MLTQSFSSELSYLLVITRFKVEFGRGPRGWKFPSPRALALLPLPQGHPGMTMVVGGGGAVVGGIVTMDEGGGAGGTMVDGGGSSGLYPSSP